MTDPVRRDHYIGKVALASKMREESIRGKLALVRSPRVTKSKSTRAKEHSVQRDMPLVLAALVLLKPKLAFKWEDDEIEDLIHDSPNQEIILELFDLCRKQDERGKEDPGKFIAKIENSELSAKLTSLILEFDDNQEDEFDNMYDDLVRKLKISSYDKQIIRLKEKIKNAQKDNDITMLTELATEKQELEKLREEELGDFHRSK